MSILDGMTLDEALGCATHKERAIGQGAKHGDARYHRAKLYYVWQGMLARCERPTASDYCRYGGRGISVCAEWHEYIPFKSWALSHGYCNGLQIDRRDNDGDYTPENCKLSTHKENSDNTRRSIRLTVNGETHCASEWSRRINHQRFAVRQWVHDHGNGYAERRIAQELDKLRALIGGAK
jgi:hypothetical protein